MIRAIKKNFKLQELIPINTLQKIQENFAEALGISAKIVDTEGNLITKVSNLSNFCKKIIINDNFQKCCTQNLLECGQISYKSGRPHIYKCHAGLYFFSVPIQIRGVLLAYIVGGQVRMENPNLEVCKKDADRINVSFDNYLDAYFELPLYTQEKLEAAANLLRIVANTISNMAFDENIAKEKEKDLVDEIKETEIKYQDLFQNANDMIFITDLDGFFLDGNTLLLKNLSISLQELLRLNVKDILHPDEFLKVKRNLNFLLFKNEDVAPYEIRLINKDKQILDIEIRNRLLIKDGKPYAIQGIARDVTKKNNILNSLKKVNDMSISGTCVCDKDGHILYTNKGFLKMFNYDYADINKIKVFDFFEDGKQKLVENMNDNPHEENFFVNVKDKYERHFVVQLKMTTILYDNKDCYLLITRDISRRKVIIEIAEKIFNFNEDELEKNITEVLELLKKKFRIFQHFLFINNEKKFELFNGGKFDDKTIMILDSFINSQLFDLNNTNLKYLNNLMTKSGDLNLECKDYIKNNNIKSAIILPLKIHQTIIGKYLLFSRENSKLSNRELDYLQIIINFLTIGCEHLDIIQDQISFGHRKAKGLRDIDNIKELSFQKNA